MTLLFLGIGNSWGIGYDKDRIKYTDIYNDNEYSNDKNIHESHIPNNNNTTNPTPSSNHNKNNNMLNEDHYQWPTTPEEYAVFALRLHRDRKLRNIFQKTNHDIKIYDKSHGDQFIEFSHKLLN